MSKRSHDKGRRPYLGNGACYQVFAGFCDTLVKLIRTLFVRMRATDTPMRPRWSQKTSEAIPASFSPDPLAPERRCGAPLASGAILLAAKKKNTPASTPNMSLSYELSFLKGKMT